MPRRSARGRVGILPTSFAEECEADLFNEQAVLWGAIPELIHAGFETLVEAGFAPEIAYFECLTEVKLLADLIYERGIAGMREAISNTAEFGALKGGTRIVTADTRTEMRRILREVRSGSFVKDLIADAEAGYPLLAAIARRSRGPPDRGGRRRLAALKDGNPRARGRARAALRPRSKPHGSVGPLAVTGRSGRSCASSGSRNRRGHGRSAEPSTPPCDHPSVASMARRQRQCRRGRDGSVVGHGLGRACDPCTRGECLR